MCELQATESHDEKPRGESRLTPMGGKAAGTVATAPAPGSTAPAEKVHGPWYKQRIPVGFCLHVFAVVALNHYPVPLWLLLMALIWNEIAHLLLCGQSRGHRYKVWVPRLIAAAGCISSGIDWYLGTVAPHLLWKSAAIRTVGVFGLMMALKAAWKDIGSVLFFLLTITAATKVTHHHFVHDPRFLNDTGCQVFIMAPIQAFITQVAIVAASDAFQYFIGKQFGRFKPVPLISPNKTIEGYVGGLVLLNILGPLVALDPLDIMYLTWFNGVILCGMLGDLAISSWKRFHMLKDTSDLLSSHGGILDRVYSHVAGFLWTVVFAAANERSLNEDYTGCSSYRMSFVTAAVWAVIWAKFIYERGTRFYRKIRSRRTKKIQ